MLARFAFRLAFVALFPSQAACKASYGVSVSHILASSNGSCIPDLDRRCILAASFLAASDMEDFEAGAGATAAGLVEGAMEDMSKVSCDATSDRYWISIGNNNDECQLVGKDRKERQ